MPCRASIYCNQGADHSTSEPRPQAHALSLSGFGTRPLQCLDDPLRSQTLSGPAMSSPIHVPREPFQNSAGSTLPEGAQPISLRCLANALVSSSKSTKSGRSPTRTPSCMKQRASVVLPEPGGPVASMRHPAVSGALNRWDSISLRPSEILRDSPSMRAVVSPWPRSLSNDARAALMT